MSLSKAASGFVDATMDTRVVKKDWYMKTITFVLAKPDDIYLQVQLVMGYRALEKSVQVVEFLLPRTFRL